MKIRRHFPRLPRKTEEHDFQSRSLKPYLDLVLPHGSFWTSIDMSGKGYLTGALRKAKGCKPGLPDVWIFWGGHAYCMELKTTDGTLSAEQLWCSKALKDAGVSTYLVRTLDDAEAALRHFGIPIRSTARVAPEPPAVTAARQGGA